tara:strand:- start:1677 stop:1838 length:162 start_codon:yes stop_codon:yes gene_type:complete
MLSIHLNTSEKSLTLPLAMIDSGVLPLKYELLFFMLIKPYRFFGLEKTSLRLW